MLDTRARSQDAQAQAEERIASLQKEAARKEEEIRREQRESQSKQQSSQQTQQEAAQPAAAAAVARGEDGGRQLEDGETTGSCAGLGDGLSDASFEKVVMDRSKDVFVLFYRKSEGFCAGNGTQYAQFAELVAETPTVVAEHMDVRLHKSPFVFEEGELPVAMLFPAEDKRPLEFDQALTPELLRDFAAEHGTTLKPKEEPALPKEATTMVDGDGYWTQRRWTGL